MTEKQAGILIEQITKAVDILNFWDGVGVFFLICLVIKIIIMIIR